MQGSLRKLWIMQVMRPLGQQIPSMRKKKRSQKGRVRGTLMGHVQNLGPKLQR